MVLSIDFDAKEVIRNLDLLKKEMNRISKRMMGAVFTQIRKDVRKQKLSGQVLKKKSGQLSKSIIYKTKADMTGYIVARAPHAGIFEHGGTILPRFGKVLTFKTEDGLYRSVKQLPIAARKFLGDIFFMYFRSNKAERLMELILDKSLKEIESAK